MAVDAQTLEEFARAFTAGQQQTMRELYASNRVVEVKAPLRVVRLNQVRELAYVRIATGPFSGKVFVLNARYVIAD